jgi:microcystin-dependent protein
MMIVMLIVSIVLAVSGPMLAKREEKILTGSVPAGTIISYAGNITILKPIPTGWLLCDGRAVSRADYLSLFNAIGTTYGTGNGTTTFNLPDLRGRVAIGVDGTGADSRIEDSFADTLGLSGGEDKHLLTTPEMPVHSHGGNTDSSSATTGTSNPAGGHTHSISDPGHAHPYTVGIMNMGDSQGNGWQQVDYTTAGTTSPSYTNISIADVSNHTHSFTVPVHTHGISSEGSGAAHNNVQPSIALNYIIKF